MKAVLVFVLSATLTLIVDGAGAQTGAAQEPAHGLAMHGALKYGPDFAHFDYVDPEAPKGGTVKLAVIGNFDSLNPYIIRGLPAAGMGLIYDTLMVNSLDEPFSEYGLLAETVQTPEDRSWVAFTLREGARFHDGTPVSVDDVLFTFEMLTTKGNPFYRQYYANVASAEQTGPRTVRFTFAEGLVNRELPLIMGQMPVLPRHDYEDRAFDETTLEPPLGSGPYRIESVDPGRSITYRRVADYWGRDLPVNVGQNNIDVIRFDYYRDATVAIEALKAHEYDFRQENISKEWATAYDVPAVRDGRMIKELIPHQLGTGMQGFVFNTRREKFSDPKVRRALAYTFDFEWTNTNLFYGQYTRTESYFSNTELAARGLPEGQELEILEAFRGRVPEEVFTTAYQAPSTDGSGEIRENLRVGRSLLEEAGWSVVDGKLTHAETGRTMDIEILLVSPAFERIAAPMVQHLKRLGVDARMRIVDPAQYQNRLDSFDFDMIVSSWGQSLSPGNEQRNYWSSAAAQTPGSQNYAGIADPVVDALIEKLIAAPDRESLVATTRALDRVLLWGHYVIPHWHIRSFRLVYWNKFGRPADIPPYGLGFPDIWWVDAARVAALKDRGAQAGADDEARAQPVAPEAEEAGEAAPGEGGRAGPSPGADRSLVLWLVLAGLVAVAVVIWLRRRRAS